MQICIAPLFPKFAILQKPYQMPLMLGRYIFLKSDRHRILMGENPDPYQI